MTVASLLPSAPSFRVFVWCAHSFSYSLLFSLRAVLHSPRFAYAVFWASLSFSFTFTCRYLVFVRALDSDLLTRSDASRSINRGDTWVLRATWRLWRDSGRRWTALWDCAVVRDRFGALTWIGRHRVSWVNAGVDEVVGVTVSVVLAAVGVGGRGGVALAVKSARRRHVRRGKREGL